MWSLTLHTWVSTLYPPSSPDGVYGVHCYLSPGISLSRCHSEHHSLRVYVADLASMYMPNPIYHQIAFAAILFSCVGRNIILWTRLPADHESRPGVKKTFSWGVVTFAMAFVIWNIDNICCDQLRTARTYLGLWGFLLEGESMVQFRES